MILFVHFELESICNKKCFGSFYLHKCFGHLQQITALKKENFNLKLRIYFMEERMQQKCDDSTEDIFKTVWHYLIQFAGFFHAFWHYYLYLCPTFSENNSVLLRQNNTFLFTFNGCMTDVSTLESLDFL